MSHPSIRSRVPDFVRTRSPQRLREWRHSLLHSWSVDSPVHDWRCARAVKLSAFALDMHVARACALVLVCRCITRCVLPCRYRFKGLTLAAWHGQGTASGSGRNTLAMQCQLAVSIAGVRCVPLRCPKVSWLSNRQRTNCHARIPTLHCHLGAHTSNQQVERTGSTPAFIR